MSRIQPLFTLNKQKPCNVQDPFEVEDICTYAACGAPGSKPALCGAPDTADKDNFFNTIEDNYVGPTFTGCYPGFNLRGGECVACGLTYNQLMELKSTDPLKEHTQYPATWDGVLETQLWRTRCDDIGCGIQSWPLIPNTPFNATAGRSQSFMVSGALSFEISHPT